MASHTPLRCPREQASKLVDDAPRGIRRFLGAVFVATWVPWLFLVFSDADPTSDLRALILLVLGGSAPTYVALALFRLEEGRSAFSNFRARMGHPPDRRWYAALALPVPIICLARLLTVGTSRAAWPDLATEHLILLPVALLSGVLVGGLEEIGWRGYLQRRMQAVLPGFRANLVIGAIWTVWHAPLLLIATTDQASYAPGWFALKGIAFSVVLGTVFNCTRGNVLLVVLLHGFDNGLFGWLTAGSAESAPAALPYIGLSLAVLAALVRLRLGPDLGAARPHQRPGEASAASAALACTATMADVDQPPSLDTPNERRRSHDQTRAG